MHFLTLILVLIHICYCYSITKLFPFYNHSGIENAVCAWKNKHKTLYFLFLLFYLLFTIHFNLYVFQIVS